MIKHLSHKLAAYVAQDDDTADVEILAYGYDLLLQEAGVILIALLIALPFGMLWHVLVSIIAYNLLRRYAGGTHAQYRIVCILSSVTFMFGPSFIFTHTPLALSPAVISGLFAADVVLLLLYAPAGTEIKPIERPALRRQMKAMSIALLAAFMVIALVISRWRADFASVLAVICTIVCLLVHPLSYRLFGCQNSASE